MSIALVSDIWNLVNEFIAKEDRAGVAHQLVGILIDYDFDLDDVDHELGNDADIKAAVSYYADEQSDDDGDDEYLDDEDDDVSPDEW